MSPAEDIAAYLSDNGIGTYPSPDPWSINIVRMPASPDSAICVYDNGGGEPIVYDVEIRQPLFEVRIRSRLYEDAEAKAAAIFALLCQPATNPPPARNIGEHRYIGIWLVSEFTSLGRDDNDRVRLSAIFRCNRQPLEVSSS